MDHSFSQPDHTVPNSARSNIVTPPSHPVPASDHAHQTTSDPPALSDFAPIESSPPSQSPPSSSLHPVSQPSHPLPHSTPALSPAQPPRPPQPAVFHVPRNSRQTVLDFSRNFGTPESKVKHALLSDNPNNNAIALVGMGGAGKTTILRALGRHTDVWQKFPDGVWFIELSHDAKVQRLLNQLKQIVTDAFPDFLLKFVELTANDDTHSNMMEKLVDLLVPKRFLLIFDDVWDLDPTVYKLVDIACKGVQEMDGGSCKVLTSTRNEAIGRVPTHDVSIAVSPGDVRRETCVEILCRYAVIDCTRLASWSSGNRDALDNIVDLCAGLPLALSVAGSGMQEVNGRCTDASGPNAIVQYWESLKRSSVELRDAESGSRHVGLDAAIQTSLVSLERVWKGKSMTIGEMFRSFCVVEKQMCIPLCVIEKMWGVEDVLARARMFSRHSLVSLDEDEGGLVRGIRLHELVHDVCVEMAEGKEGVRGWHCQVLDGYRGLLRTSQGVAEDHAMNAGGEGTESEEEEWWELKGTEKYMSENVVRHLLRAGRVSATLKLLTDYRWTEKMNKNEERPPFQKVIGELELVRRHLEEEEKTEIGRRIVSDLYVVARAMERCMAPYCMKNREECTFQLFGRLRDVVSESGLVERIVCSIEEYAERPWARCGPGVLRSGRSLLRRVLEVEGGGGCMCVRGGGEEVIVGGRRGKIWVLDGRDGRVKRTLAGDEDSYITAVFFDCISGLMYSCNWRGQVTIWKEENKLRSMHVQVEDKEEIGCMQVLPSSKKVVLGTSKGRLLVMDTTSGRIVGTVAAHSRRVSSLAMGGSETVMVSGSWDGTIRAWDTKSFDDSGTVFKGHTGLVRSVALSADGRLLASASSWDDTSVRLWDVPSGEPLWTSPDEYDTDVVCVLFSSDERLLYSVSLEETRVWRVENGGRDVSLAHTLPISSTSFSISFGLGDGPELFVLSHDRVQVWDARQVDCSDDSVAAFLQLVETFGVSENGTTMLTLNYDSERMEIRNVCDVCDRIDRVISSFEIPAYDRWHPPESLAISNNQRFVAYSIHGSCVVHIVDARDGNVLHSLYDLDQWALSSTRDEQDNASNSSNSGDSSSTARVEQMNKNVGLLSFSSDSTVISAFAAANPNPNDDNATTVVTKSVSWNVSSGKPIGETLLDAESTAMSSTATPRLVCNPQFDGEDFRFPRNVKYEHGQSSFTIATMEDDVIGAHYISDASRLLFSSLHRGMGYVDLITDNTHLPPRNAPPLPLPQPHPLAPPSQHTITDIEADEVYDVFISHAGTDKFTIALLLYNLLVALGFKVFLDRPELRPGENAPEKMIKAMRTAKIAVVILSPEYAARKWTLKELMCFLERYRAGGEREIVIIPVFYRLTLDDCRDEKSLFGVKNDKGENVFLVEGFLEWMSKQKELTIEKVLKGLQSLRGVTGIENEAKVTNGKSEEEKAGQMQFAEKIRDAVVEAKDRQNSKRAAGPSSAR